MNGFQSGLELVINNNPADYFASEIPSVGVKVLIHHPYKFPDLSLPSHIFEMNTNNLLGINPEMITATERLKSMPVRNRKCLFPSEKKLNMFQRYTRRGCLMECRLAMTLKVCKCVPFDLHSQSYSYGSLKVCGLEDLSCLNHNRDAIFNITHLKHAELFQDDKCNCPNNCEDFTYPLETSRGILDASFTTNPSMIFSNLHMENQTIIRIFFSDLLGIKYRRDVSFPWHSLMGNYGGILGFFTGFSLTSVVEIFYTTFIRRRFLRVVAKPSVSSKTLPTIRFHPKLSYY
ncbi:sodium channel protein Nach [Dendroctonus ponderosae]|uniref:Uncharacterized protein n=1 Tax=Dendroctonus ponderosae TaxID=77166 RepID=A0AAR5PGE8_DENPD|nr:sodium channel protein Nach [Dendroctonus ponderosae]KAH1013764.1 hypothetical protein HUJ04_002709 [Dendroctonus ponderosae]